MAVSLGEEILRLEYKITKFKMCFQLVIKLRKWIRIPFRKGVK